MKVKVITADQVILLDGKPEWCAKEGCGFVMPDNEWALSFDTVTGLGEVEYTDYRNNQVIGEVEYANRYQFLEQHHLNAKSNREEREAAELAAGEQQQAPA